MISKSIYILCLLLIILPTLSQTTGKIKGIVFDESGAPLQHANVTVDGTKLGAETDEDGYYYIIGVKAGTYTLKAQLVGYEIKEIKNIIVKLGLTTSRDFVLKIQPYDFGVIECKVPSYFKYNFTQNEIKLIKEELNLLPDELNDDKILSILNSDQHSFLLQEFLVSKIKDQNVLKQIFTSDLSIIIKNEALSYIIDFDFLSHYYLNHFDRNNIYKYDESILERLPDEYLLKIIKIFPYPELEYRHYLFIDDQDILLSYVRRSRNKEVLRKIKDYDKREAFYWEIDDENFREDVSYFIDYSKRYSIKGENFAKRVLKEINSPRTRATAIEQIDPKTNYKFLTEYFEKDTTDVVREKILQKIYYSFFIDTRQGEDSIRMKAKEFFKIVEKKQDLSENISKKMKDYIDRFRKEEISAIENPDELEKLLYLEKDPEMCAYILKSYIDLFKNNQTKNKYYITKSYNELDQFLMKYVMQNDSLDEQIIYSIVKHSENSDLLKKLYFMTKRQWHKRDIISKIKDEKFINEILNTENHDSVIISEAIAKLTDQKMIKRLFKKYQSSERYFDLLLWRSNDKRTIQNIIEKTKNDTLVLIGEMKKEILSSDNSNSLDKFFDNWHKAIKPFTEQEYQELDSLKKNAQELYNLFLNRNLKESFDDKYFVIRTSIYLTTEDSKNSGKDEAIIAELRPSVDKLNDKTLYLDPKYRKVINGYFSNYSNRHISALKAVTGDYYMETFPVLMSIDFEQNMTKAVLNIDGFSTVREEFYLKKNGKWKCFDQPKQFWKELNK